jgi:hypothetical protein
MEYLCCCGSSDEGQKKPKIKSLFGRKYKKFDGEEVSQNSQEEHEGSVSENVTEFNDLNNLCKEEEKGEVMPDYEGKLPKSCNARIESV